MRSPTSVSTFVLASTLTASLAGCQGTGAAMMTGAPESRFCEYSDFSVDITAGPSAGLHLAGSLLLEEALRTGSLSGSLKTSDGSRIPVSGSVYKSGDIALTFHTKSGYVMGLGKLGDNFCKSGAMITGIAIGPRVDMNSMVGQSDTGHWILAGSYLIFQPITTTLTLEPSDPSVITISSGGGTTTFNSVTCQMGSTQVSDNCCSGNAGGGGTPTTCRSGGVTCSTPRSNGATTADLCCDGTKAANSSVPDCAQGVSKIES